MKSLLLFIAAAILLRMVAVLAWGFFPSTGLFPQLARVSIPLFVAIGFIMLNQRMLLRDGFPRDALGMHPRRFGWFFAGGLIITPVILLIAGALWLLVPFHWERGSMSSTRLLWQTAEYFGGNLGEELAFRGYLLVLLTRYLGLTRALFITAILFGIFHLPGLTGLTALKMVCTTAGMSFLFAYGFILTGSLWTAAGMHVLGNVVLHQVFGMGGGASILAPVMHRPWPDHYDPAFFAWLSIVIPLAMGGAFLVKRLRSRSSL